MVENGTAKVLTLAAADAAIEEIENHRSRLVGTRTSIAAKLEVLELSAGARYLAGDRTVTREISELREELDLIEHALATLDGRQVAATANLKRSIIADVRRQVEVKCAELARLEKETGKLLKALSALEGVSYEWGILSLQHSGAWYAEGIRAPKPWQAAFVDLFPDPTNGDRFAQPQSRKLREEIKELESKAEALEGELTGLPSQAPAVQLDYLSAIVEAPEPSPGYSNRSYANKAAE